MAKFQHESPTLTLILLLAIVCLSHLLRLHLLSLHLLHLVPYCFSFHSKASNQLFTGLLAATESTESSAICLHLATIDTECHETPTPNSSLNPRIQLTICMNTGHVSNSWANALSVMSSSRGSVIISAGSTPASNNS